MSLRPANPCGEAGIAYPEVKLLFCRVPLAEFPCHALACSASSTCNSSRYGRAGSDALPFHGLRGLGCLARLCLFSSQRDSKALSDLCEVSSTTPTPKRQECTLRCRVYRHGNGILTIFPFGSSLLAFALGSPNSELKNIAQKPVCYAASRILAWICCY